MESLLELEKPDTFDKPDSMPQVEASAEIIAAVERAVQSTGMEFVAVELAIAARRQTGGLGEFQSQLDRIAGTRVL